MNDTWIDVPDESDFSVDNLPIGVVATEHRGRRRRVATRVGDSVIPLGDVFLGATYAHVFEQSTANAFLALGPVRWSEIRDRLQTFVTDRRHARPLPSVSDVEIHVPVDVGDYVDFYSSIDHATRVGRLFRPESEPLLPNWRRLPVGYHGRSSTIIPSGVPVVRPSGLIATDGSVRRGPTERLDFELEVGFVVGTGNHLGEPVAPADADRHVFGAVLVNDWSARDIQSFEYQPLGPFGGKSFATTISPWIVPLAALAPFRVPGPAQTPPPDAGLANPDRHGFDVTVQAAVNGSIVGLTSMRHLYWTHDQQYAHLTSNGCATRPGDLFATGTISGPGDDECGCLLEATAGQGPWLADGDTVTLTGWAGGDRRLRVGFGDCTGTVLPRRKVSDTFRRQAIGAVR